LGRPSLNVERRFWAWLNDGPNLMRQLTTRKPNFFVLGAPKCGTTSLAQWLASHPSVFMSPEKEPHFFNTDDRRLVTTVDKYADLFGGADERHVALGEASVWYLSSSEAVRNILQFQPEAKFVVMLRNPVEMAPALHAEMVLSGHENVCDFVSAWGLQADRREGRHLPALCWANRRLLYGDVCSLGVQLQRLRMHVPSRRILTILQDDVIDSPRREYLRVLRFLGVKDDGRSEFPIFNKAKIARWPPLTRFLFVFTELKGKTGINLHLRLSSRLSAANVIEAPRPSLSPDTKGKLQAYFASDVALLGRLLNRDLGHWLGSTPDVANLVRGTGREFRSTVFQGSSDLSEDMIITGN
jgi:hypothetical protein